MMRKGSTVRWKWVDSYTSGTVNETFDRKVSRTIDGNEVTRKGGEGNKALLIKHEDGQQVLKLESEVGKN